MNTDQLDIRDLGDGNFRLEFPYNPDFIEFLKMKVPPSCRTYDPDTHIWTVRGSNFIGHLEGIGLQKFGFVARTFQRGNDLVIRNCRTGAESVQKGLF
jgi:hypothetical protein